MSISGFYTRKGKVRPVTQIRRIVISRVSEGSYECPLCHRHFKSVEILEAHYLHEKSGEAEPPQEELTGDFSALSKEEMAMLKQIKEHGKTLAAHNLTNDDTNMLYKLIDRHLITWEDDGYILTPEGRDLLNEDYGYFG